CGAGFDRRTVSRFGPTPEDAFINRARLRRLLRSAGRAARSSSSDGLALAPLFRHKYQHVCSQGDDQALERKGDKAIFAPRDQRQDVGILEILFEEIIGVGSLHCLDQERPMMWPGAPE